MEATTRQMTKRPVLVFLRAPRLGQVKTRLARTLGTAAVLALYRCFVKDTLAAVAAAGGDALLFVHPPEAAREVTEEFGPGYRVFPQEGSDLGERMARAFARMFAAGCRRALLVGADIPHLPPRVYRDAFDALRRRGTVIGPASDGGYYLIGFRKDSYTPGVFQQMPWGTDRVLQHTCARLAARGDPPHRLPVYSDIDVYGDLLALARSGGHGARMTNRWLERNRASLPPFDPSLHTS